MSGTKRRSRGTEDGTMVLITTTIEKMMTTLPRLGAEFDAARERYAELAPFTTVTEVATALKADSALTNAERGKICGALVREHQKHGGKLAQSLLLVALEKSLTATRLGLKRLSDEDLDQVVMHAFLEALALPGVLSAGSYAPVALALETKRIVKRMLRPAKRAPKTFEYDETRMEEARTDESLASWTGEPNCGDVEAELERLFDVVGSEQMREVLMATVAGNETLRAYVSRCLPGVALEQQNTEYERLKKQRVAALLRLRALGPMETAEAA